MTHRTADQIRAQMQIVDRMEGRYRELWLNMRDEYQRLRAELAAIERTQDERD